ncbi:MAG: hypothetical protein JWN36_2365 [Microbacteriaceae bacterium]|nr:hypothetical protein [Microbacteriaceae bacterium]
MNLETVTARSASPALMDDTEDLISEWAVRVLEFSSGSRRPAGPVLGREDDLIRAYRVRDRLNNRLRCGAGSVSSCSAEMSDILRSSDELLVELTEEADTLEALTAHNHYAKASEWWWKRLLVAAA